MRANPERFALNVLLSAFGVFVLLCGGAIYGVQWFIFQSQMPLSVTLVVSRGTVSVLPPDTETPIAVTDLRPDLEIGALIATDSSSQGFLEFEDPRTGRLVAQWVLHPDSSVVLEAARAPRFGLNRKPYSIVGTGLSGESEALLLSSTTRPVNFGISTPHATALLRRTGHYLLTVSDEDTRLVTREGLAELVRQGTRSAQVDPGARAIASRSDDDVSVQAAEADLAENGNFRLPDMAGWEPYWLGSEPEAHLSSIIFEGRPVVLLDRPADSFEDGVFAHGELGLEQDLDVSVQDDSFLGVRVTFRVTEQSLSTCGVAGSECPLMVRLDYTDAEGEERVWIHGFYVEHNPSLEYPLRCDSCAIDHERVAPDRWYTFESGNLMALLPAEQEPSEIQSLRMYASGHAFKTYVAEMSLLAAP